jgi:hypothetical protein
MAPIDEAIADLESQEPEERYTLKEISEKHGVERAIAVKRSTIPQTAGST